jgi:hypothetical protein
MATVVPDIWTFNYPASQPIDPQNLPSGLIVLKGAGRRVRGEGGATLMPPPPAEKLEDWQIEMLESWAINPR